jgi:hypothetical protein
MYVRKAFIGVATTALLGAGIIVAAGPTSAATVGIGSPRDAIAVSAADSTGTKTATATCPTGTVVIGGGGSISGGGDQVRIRGLFPVGATAFRVIGKETVGGYAGNWSVTAQARCATPPAGLEYRAATATGSSSDVRAVRATCTSDRKVIGVGAAVGGDQIAIDAVAPSSDLTSVLARTYLSGGTSTAMNVTAYAICANPIPGQYRQQASGGSPQNFSVLSMQDYCRQSGRPYVATSLGYANTDAKGAVVLTNLSFGQNNQLVVKRLGPDTTFAWYWSTTMYQVCTPQ